MSKEIILDDNLSSENVKSYDKSTTNVLEKDKKSLTLDILFSNINETLPEFLRPKDLIKLGLFKSGSDLSWAMKRNQSPPFIRLSVKKIIFSRICLCEWLKQKSLSVDLNHEVGNARP